MNKFVARFVAQILSILLLVTMAGCGEQSKLNSKNFDRISTGMSKAQVENILGTPTKVETTDMFIFKKTVYRYEHDKKFAMVTFKNDEVDGKESNLNAGK